jgi:hypothetical protein
MSKKINRQVTVAGTIMFIPAVLFAGGFAGYMVSEYFVWRGLLRFCVMGIFFAGSVFEAMRLIRFALILMKEENAGK